MRWEKYHAFKLLTVPHNDIVSRAGKAEQWGWQILVVFHQDITFQTNFNTIKFPII